MMETFGLPEWRHVVHRHMKAATMHHIRGVFGVFLNELSHRCALNRRDISDYLHEVSAKMTEVLLPSGG